MTDKMSTGIGITKMQDQYKILIVDDEALVRTMVTGILEDAGFVVIEADSGASCLEIAKIEKPDLIILDVVMPDIDGFETCDNLRNEEDTCAIPVIFVSGLDNRFSILKALRVGATDYIIKPIEAEDVIVRVKNVLTTRSLINDKINLLKINEAMVEKVKDFLQELSIVKTVDDLKSDIQHNSISTLDYLNQVRDNINEYNEDAALAAVTNAEVSLQFADRVSQQLNEFAKILDKIHVIMSGVEHIDANSDIAKMMHSSSDSVLMSKTSQDEVDDLLDSLNI